MQTDDLWWLVTVIVNSSGLKFLQSFLNNESELCINLNTSPVILNVLHPNTLWLQIYPCYLILPKWGWVSCQVLFLSRIIPIAISGRFFLLLLPSVCSSGTIWLWFIHIPSHFLDSFLFLSQFCKAALWQRLLLKTLYTRVSQKKHLSTSWLRARLNNF